MSLQLSARHGHARAAAPRSAIRSSTSARATAAASTRRHLSVDRRRRSTAPTRCSTTRATPSLGGRHVVQRQLRAHAAHRRHLVPVRGRGLQRRHRGRANEANNSNGCQSRSSRRSIVGTAVRHSPAGGQRHAGGRRQRHLHRRRRQRHPRRRRAATTRPCSRTGSAATRCRISAPGSRSPARTAATRSPASSTCSFANGTVNLNDGNALFDTLYYMRNNLDVFEAGVERARSTTRRAAGAKDAIPIRSSTRQAYLAANRDVRKSGMNPLDHYHQIGWKRGPRSRPRTSTPRLYLVAQSGRGGGRHRSARALPAVRPGRGPPGLRGDRRQQARRRVRRRVLPVPQPGRRRRPASMRCAHYNTFGWHEGRNPNAFFDTAGYLAHYADVAAAGINPLCALRERPAGRKAAIRRPPSIPTAISPPTPTSRQAHINPLDHYLLQRHLRRTHRHQRWALEYLIIEASKKDDRPLP